MNRVLGLATVFAIAVLADAPRQVPQRREWLHLACRVLPPRD